jgi:preprotein translocase subunit YajC
MGGGNPMSSLVMIIAMIAIFYLFMIRPQAKKQRELKKFREAMKPGDKVVTIGGIHGKILEIGDSTVLISSEGTKIRLEKSAITQTVDDQLSAIK